MIIEYFVEVCHNIAVFCDKQSIRNPEQWKEILTRFWNLYTSARTVMEWNTISLRPLAYNNFKYAFDIRELWMSDV